MSIPEPSKSAVRRAGSTIRKHRQGQCSEDDFNTALDIVTAYRATFAVPLKQVHSDLNTFLDPSETDGFATHRLKKVPTIVDKLSREPGLDLSRMQDLGGCRVVFKDIDGLEFFASQVRLQWDGRVHHEKDYIASPRESGYRGLHIIVEQDGKLIEIQLRTTIMHSWAELVEAFSAVAKINLKQDGSHTIQEFMKLNSRIGATHEGLTSSPFSQEELDKMYILKAEVEGYLEELKNELERNT